MHKRAVTISRLLSFGRERTPPLWSAVRHPLGHGLRHSRVRCDTLHSTLCMQHSACNTLHLNAHGWTGRRGGRPSSWAFPCARERHQAPSCALASTRDAPRTGARCLSARFSVFCASPGERPALLGHPRAPLVSERMTVGAEAVSPSRRVATLVGAQDDGAVRACSSECLQTLRHCEVSSARWGATPSVPSGHSRGQAPSRAAGPVRLAVSELDHAPAGRAGTGARKGCTVPGRSRDPRRRSAGPPDIRAFEW